MKFLVTGGLGFIGSNLVDVLVEAGHQVVIFDNDSTGHHRNTHPNVTTIIGDICNTNDLAKIGLGIDRCVHLAAAVSVAESMTQPEKYMKINVDGSRNVLEWCRQNGCNRIVSASTAAYYGNPAVLPCKEDFPYAGISPYADAKYQMELLHKEYSEKYGMIAGCCRFFNVYGPRQDPTSAYSGVISKFFEFACTNQPLGIFGDGENTRDFVFVRDVAAAVLLFLEKATGFRVFNVGTEQARSLKVLAAEIIKVSGCTAGMTFKPRREGDIIHSCSSTERIRSELGFAPAVTFEQGINITYKWYVANLPSLKK